MFLSNLKSVKSKKLIFLRCNINFAVPWTLLPVAAAWVWIFVCHRRSVSVHISSFSKIGGKWRGIVSGTNLRSFRLYLDLNTSPQTTLGVP